MHVRKGDKVLVITGNDKGKTGKVLKVFRDKNKVVVEGIRLIKRHTRPSQKNQQGGIVEKEAPIDASNVMLVCPKCDKATRVGHKTEDGKKIPLCVKCGKAIDSGRKEELITWQRRTKKSSKQRKPRWKRLWKKSRRP